MSPLNYFKRSKHPSDLWVPIHTRHDVTPEDIFSDAVSPLSNEPEEKKLEVPVNPFTTRVFFLSVFAALLFLAGYSAYLTVRWGDEYQNLATLNAQRVHEMGAPRGQILSADGKVLAYSELGFHLIIEPTKLPKEEIGSISQELSEYFNTISREHFSRIITSASDRRLANLILVKNLTEAEVSVINPLLVKYPALSLEERPLRIYPEGSTYSHVLGYTASITSEELVKIPGYKLTDSIGKKGVEFYYERFLRGAKGLFAKFVSARGDVVEEKILQPTRDGNSIQLTLDSQIQADTRKALQNALIRYNIDSAAAVVMDPNTGNILAMVSLPDFDPNHFSEGLTDIQAEAYFQNSNKPLFNRVTMGEYATGSVIKPLIAGAALEEGIISENKVLQTYGHITVPSVYDPSVVYRFNDWKNHGAVDMREAIAVSSNVYFYTIGGGYEAQKGLGIERISDWLGKFGWGKTLGVNFASEATGLVPTPEWKKEKKNEPWQIGDTYNVSIGQGDILATPLQVATATSVFANGGTLYKPNAISSIYTQDGVVQEVPKGDIINENFLSLNSINVVREGMRRAVQSGSSIYFRSLPVTSAGKTGTAQTSRENNAWFSGFAPYENTEIVVTVLLEEGETSNNAVRVAYDIFNSYFKYKHPELYPEPKPEPEVQPEPAPEQIAPQNEEAEEEIPAP